MLVRTAWISMCYVLAMWGKVLTCAIAGEVELGLGVQGNFGDLRATCSS
jgi:hypothetical protein